MTDKVKIQYSMSTDGRGRGSGGVDFDDFVCFYAVKKGILRPRGFELVIVERPGGRPAMNQLLINREVDVGIISLATAVRKFGEGLNLRLLCRERRFEGGGGGVFVMNSSEIKSASDLQLAKAIMFHDKSDSERLIDHRAILEKRFGLNWRELRFLDGT